MIQFYVYNSGNGQVLARGFYDEVGDGAAARAVGVGVIIPATEYAPAGVKTARPVFNLATLLLDKITMLANNVEVATFVGVPTGTVFKVFKDQDAFPRGIATVTDGTLVFKTDTAGVYQFVLSNFPTQDTTFTITATS